MTIISSKERAIKMSELAKRKTVEHNDLITSVAKMDKIPLKIFELAVSCIDIDNPPKDHVIYLSKKELFLFFDVTDTNKHSRFKEAVETMQKQAYFEIKQASGKGFKFKSIVPIPTVAWNDYDDEVMIRFNVDIMPYLIDLKKNFTQYAISDIMELNSKYSITIYKWICMNFNQYEHYQFKGNRTNEQLEELKNPIIQIDELRRLTDTADEYQRADNFEKWVLEKPTQEISKHTHFNVRYEKIKKGRRIEYIQFFVEKKDVPQNAFYKEEEQDEAYLKDKENKEKQLENLYNQAMESEFTDILGDNQLITFKDVRDKLLMANIQKNVYPMYEDLKKLQGIKEVRKHINYVAHNRIDYSKKNIAKYLHVSICDYLRKLKNNPHVNTTEIDKSIIHYNWLK